MLFNNYEDLEDFIKKNVNAENRNCEFKSANKWDGDFRFKIVRGILCMANARDGGSIIMGVDENKSQGTFIINPLSKVDANTFSHDEIMKFVNAKYADPSINLVVQRFEHDGTELINIHVSEFETQPIICKGDYNDILQKGKIYSRSHSKPECTSNLTGEEMREILDIATKNALKVEIKRLQELGIIPSFATTTSKGDHHKQQFLEERKGF